MKDFGHSPRGDSVWVWRPLSTFVAAWGPGGTGRCLETQKMHSDHPSRGYWLTPAGSVMILHIVWLDFAQITIVQIMASYWGLMLIIVGIDGRNFGFYNNAHFNAFIHLICELSELFGSKSIKRIWIICELWRSAPCVSVEQTPNRIQFIPLK